MGYVLESGAVVYMTCRGCFETCCACHGYVALWLEAVMYPTYTLRFTCPLPGAYLFTASFAVQKGSRLFCRPTVRLALPALAGV
jgi:hypothetical protein